MAIQRPSSRQPIPSNAKRVFKGKLFDVHQWKQRLFDGSQATFEKISRPDTAYAIPVTPSGKLVLAEQEQPGSLPVVGLLGGRVEKGEMPEAAARRELLEEAGLEAGALVLWEAFQFLPKIDWAICMFAAKQCSPAARALEPGERVRLVEVTFDEFVQLVAHERFGDVEVALTVLRIAQDSARLAAARALFDAAA